MARKRLEVEIAGDAASAEAALAGLGSSLDALSDKRIEIKAEDTELRRKIVEDKELIAELGTEEGRARLGIDDAEAKAKIAELKADIDSIGLKRARLAVDNAEALGKIAETKAAIDAIHDKDVHVNVDKDGAGRAAVSDLGKKFDETAGKIPTMVAAAGLLGPAIIPAAAAATAGVGALLVPLTAASLGFGALGVFAFPVLSGIGEVMQKTINPAFDAFKSAQPGPAQNQAWKDLETQINALPPGEKEVVQGIVDLKREALDLGQSIRPQMLGAFNTFLDDGKKLLPQLVPLAKEAALALNDLGTSVSKGLDSPAWHTFLDKITPEIRPAIDSIGRSMGNLVKGLGGVVEAFIPFAGTVESGMERVTRAFANWGTQLGSSSGFQKFMDYLRQNGPQLKATIEDIGRAGESLIKAFAGFGGFNLKILDDLAKAINAIASAPGGAVALEITALALAAGKLASVASLGTIIADLTRIPAAIRAFQGTEGIIGGLGTALGTLTGKAAPAEAATSKLADSGKTLGAVLPGMAGGGELAAGAIGGLSDVAIIAAPIAVGLGLTYLALTDRLGKMSPAVQAATQHYKDWSNAALGAGQNFNVLAQDMGVGADKIGSIVSVAQQAGLNLNNLSSDTQVASQQIVQYLQQIASGAINTTPAIRSAAQQWLAQIRLLPQAALDAQTQIQQATNLIAQDWNNLPRGLQPALTTISNQLHTLPPVAQAAGLQAESQLADALRKGQAPIAAQQDAQQVEAAFTELNKIPGMGQQAMDALGQAIRGGAAQTGPAVQQMVGDITSKFGQLPPALQTAGAHALAELATAIATGNGPAITAAINDVIAVENAMNQLPPAAQQTGATAGSTFGSGISSATGAVGNAAKGLGQAAEANAHADLSGAGANAGQSFAAGVASAAGAAAAAGAAVAHAAAAAAAANQSSPDKVTMEIGANAGLGYALGLEQQLSRVQAATARLTGAAYGGFAAGPSSYGGLSGASARIVSLGAVHVHLDGTGLTTPDTTGNAIGQAVMRSLYRELRAT